MHRGRHATPHAHTATTAFLPTLRTPYVGSTSTCVVPVSCPLDALHGLALQRYARTALHALCLPYNATALHSLCLPYTAIALRSRTCPTTLQPFAHSCPTMLQPFTRSLVPYNATALRSLCCPATLRPFTHSACPTPPQPFTRSRLPYNAAALRSSAFWHPGSSGTAPLRTPRCSCTHAARPLGASMPLCVCVCACASVHLYVSLRACVCVPLCACRCSTVPHVLNPVCLCVLLAVCACVPVWGQPAGNTAVAKGALLRAVLPGSSWQPTYPGNGARPYCREYMGGKQANRQIGTSVNRCVSC